MQTFNQLKVFNPFEIIILYHFFYYNIKLGSSQTTYPNVPSLTKTGCFMKKESKSKFDSYQNYLSSFLIETISLKSYLKCLQKCCQDNKCQFLIADQAQKLCFSFTQSFKVNSFTRLNELSPDSSNTFYFTK